MMSTSLLDVRRRRQRGATMVSVMLLTVSLLTVAVLVIRSADREVRQAGALVARDRALMAAQSTIELGAAQYRTALAAGNVEIINFALTGYNVPGDPGLCTSIYEDCIPGGDGNGAAPATGQRNRWVTGKSDCAGRPCMRQGAIAFLPDGDNVNQDWINIPLRTLLEDGDPEAQVSLWVRNNEADALASGDGSWTVDNDGRVVLTAMATVRNTTVAVAQEFVLDPNIEPQPWSMQSPDFEYGGGHNNDNAVADVCTENFVGYQE